MLMHVLIFIEAVLTNIVVLTNIAVIARSDNGQSLTEITNIIFMNCNHAVDLLDQLFLAASF